MLKLDGDLNTELGIFFRTRWELQWLRTQKWSMMKSKKEKLLNPTPTNASAQPLYATELEWMKLLKMENENFTIETPVDSFVRSRYKKLHNGCCGFVYYRFFEWRTCESLMTFENICFLIDKIKECDRILQKSQSFNS